MFKLQRLEITGFKSFADYTEIIFTGDGITAIVGPNGCGKSNVADAIAWVLGEQRVKHLRGGEMKDVIFQGSRNRAPSGMAEVVMHLVRDAAAELEPDIEDIDWKLEQIDENVINLDAVIETAPETGDSGVPIDEAVAEENRALWVPENATEIEASETSAPHKAHPKRHWRRRNLALEFAPGESVAVTRRLYRSGESEYLLNNRLCRLRDIQDLFSGTGLSGGHYAIIEQGRIGQILSAKPMDRRTIIEEAAGITKFRVRQRAAETRLESARSNLSRISDIISEIDRQVNSLRRQAAKARRYRVFREELRDLLRRVFVAEDRKLTNLLNDTDAKLAQVNGLQRRVAEELASREEGAREATQGARNIEDELAAARAGAAEAVLRRDRQIRERTYQEEQLTSLDKRKGEVGVEIEALSARLVLVESECKRLQEEDVRLRTDADESALSLKTAENAYAQKLAAALTAEQEIENARADLLQHTAVAERLREIARQLEGTLERLALQAHGLERERERATSQHAERKTEADALAAQIAVAREHIVRLNAERETAVVAVVRGHEAVSDTEAEVARVRDDSSRTKHRLESLKELDERRAYYSSAVQRIFSQDALKAFHFVGTLADALNVEAKWERAVEGVLGSSLQSIIVPTLDDAARAALWLRENNAGRASFLVAGLQGASEETNTLVCKIEDRPALPLSYSSEGIDDLLISDLLGAPRELLAVLKRTLPQKMNARVASNLDDAMTKSLATDEMFVTLNGDWVTRGQFVSAGDARALEEGAGLLAFKRELRELEARAKVLAAELNSAEKGAKEARSSLVGLEDTVVLLNEAIGREEREVMARELTANGLAQEIERAERHLRVVADDVARVREEQIELEQRRATALNEAEAAEAARLAAGETVVIMSGLLANARTATELESGGLAEQRAQAAAAAERRRATATELRRMEAEYGDLAARVERHRFEVVEMAGRGEDLRQSIAYLQHQAGAVEQERAREDQEIAALAVRLEVARQHADVLSAELSDINRRAGEIRDLRAAIEVERAEAQARLTFVSENCAAELNQPLEELVREQPLEEEFDLDAGHAQIENLRSRIEGVGAVNMMALEELSEAEERLLFLTAQRQDIVDGIASTDEALREIKRRSRERFRQAFEQINKNFGELFQELFGGGRGEMSLIEADDVLESGIDVVAQPPGKRLQNVLLLSGGEKAMAALALVLGIFQYRPAPFCLLDEVDAPLDEANVGRFTDKVVQMSANTQFIVITHNKRTMETARALYGVTMEDVGISKLVSVKFE